MIKKIIFAGKGGSGKTTISSLVITYIKKHYPKTKILVIDADPSHTLSESLGITKDITDLIPIGELETLIPDNWDYNSSEFFSELINKSIAKIPYLDSEIEYAYMGHHTKNSCMCSYNNTLNYMLKHIDKLALYDLIILDREAGIEHINRSVYGNKNDKLVIVTWPTSEYVQVAKQILDLADILGTTSQRLLIVNNIHNLQISHKKIQSYLKNLEINLENVIIFPYLRLFDDFKKLNANQILIENIENTSFKKSLKDIINFIKN